VITLRSLTVAESKPDPKLYVKMSEPRPVDEVEASSRAFVAAIAKLRKKHKLSEVVVTFAANTTDNKAMIGAAQWGDAGRAALLTAKMQVNAVETLISGE
jgi:hypothetical protein